MIFSNLLSKIDNARELDFGTIFNLSIELYKKSWLQGFLMQLITLVITLPLILILYVPFFIMIITQSESGTMDPNLISTYLSGLSFVYALFFILGILVIATISVALNAGFFRILKDLDHDKPVTTSQLFYFFKKEYIGKAFLLMIITILIAIPSALLCYIPLIYTIVPINFFVAIFAFNAELGVGDLVKAAFKLGNKKWLLTFGLLFVSYFAIMLLTVITCGLGSLFLSPFIYHPIYYVYKEVIGFDDITEMDNIGKI